MRRLVCRFILSPSLSSNGMNDYSWNFLHDIPIDIDHRWNLTEKLHKCAETSSTHTRMEIYEDLIDLLDEIGQNTQ